MLESAHGWASERAFSKWVSKQEWRACLPRIFEFTVERVTLPNFMKFFCFISFWPNCSFQCALLSFTSEGQFPQSEAKARMHSKMKHVRLGVFLPHEIASAFYTFRSGDLFYSLLTGTPADPWLHNSKG